MVEALRTLYRSNPVLAVTGWAHVALLTILIVIAPFDSRTILGINPWIKPIKFSASIAIYVWTLAWLLRYIARPVRWINWGVAVSMFVEIFCITLQSARGVRSHFNVGTALDAGIFNTMGGMIALNSILVVWVLVLFFREKPEIPRAYLWGIRWGLIVFLVASGVGGMMVGHQAHTVGADDGGPGLPLVNWSTEHGDLRISHFVGMHALQILPLFGYLASRARRPAGVQVASVIAAGCVYLGVTMFLVWMAWQGRALLA